MKNNEQINIAIITLDSLRYDVTLALDLPNFRKLLLKSGMKRWAKVYSHGTFTLPSHIALFQSGMFPCSEAEGVEFPYNRKGKYVFKPTLSWNGHVESLYELPEAENIVRGFEKIGYRTIGVGGVNWFNNKFKTSDFWGKLYFQDFYWKEEFSEKNPKSFEEQIDFIRPILEKVEDPLFYFHNVSSTHHPFCNFPNTVMGQAQSLKYVDHHIMDLIDIIPKPLHLFICSDHGECFGEDGIWGHAKYHEKVMEVPMLSVFL